MRSFTLTFYVHTKGVYTIPGAVFYYKNKKYTTQSVTITILDAQNNSANPQNPATNDSRTFNINDNIFIRVIADKSQVYIGEQVVLTYKLYSRIRYEGMQMVKAPNYDKCALAFVAV